jgi:quercetin dioxygenase-like cupin family protein
MTELKPAHRPVRRVVTAHDRQKRAKVVRDDIASNTRSREGASSTEVWCSDRTPARMQAYEGGEDMGARRIATASPPSGTRFIVRDLEPGCRGAMHRTNSLDYVVVMEGEVNMDMDDSSVTLKAGDVMVLQGGNHAWGNRSDKPARFAVVLVDAEPLGEGFPPAFK